MAHRPIWSDVLWILKVETNQDDVLSIDALLVNDSGVNCREHGRRVKSYNVLVV